MFGWFKKKQTVGDVLQAYGDLLAKYPLSMMDVSMLPVPKAKMKVVLKSLYAQARTKDEQRLLENGFFLLSNFQDGVGASPISMTLPNTDIIENLEAHQAALEKWRPLHKLAEAELGILSAEWKRFLAGDPI